MLLLGLRPSSRSTSEAASNWTWGSISELVIQFDQSPGGTNWCGLLVRWGDGQEQILRIGDDQFKTSPAIVPHTYTKAGSFRVDVEGRPWCVACGLLSGATGDLRLWM